MILLSMGCEFISFNVINLVKVWFYLHCFRPLIYINILLVKYLNTEINLTWNAQTGPTEREKITNMPQDICVPCNPFFYCSFLCLLSLYYHLFNSLFFYYYYLVILYYYYYYIILILDFWLWAAGNKTGMDSRADKRLTRRRRSNRPYTSSEDQVWYTNIINLILP